MSQVGPEDFLSIIKIVLSEELPSEKVDDICYKLSDIAGGCEVYISKMCQQRLSVRNKSIKTDKEKGLTVTRLATKYLLSERQISRIIRQ